MTYVIVWQDIPEHIRVYEYSTNDNSFIEKIERCHRNYLGLDSEVEEDIVWLSELLGGVYTEDTGLFVGGIDPAYDSEKHEIESRYTGCRVNGKLIVTGHIM